MFDLRRNPRGKRFGRFCSGRSGSIGFPDRSLVLLFSSLGLPQFYKTRALAPIRHVRNGHTMHRATKSGGHAVHRGEDRRECPERQIEIDGTPTKVSLLSLLLIGSAVGGEQFRGRALEAID